MSVKFRHYNGEDDYKLVDQFLIRHYMPDNADRNWIQPAWEYMHSHSLLDKASLGKIRIWEEDGEIVAVAHYELSLGEVFFQFHPCYRYLRQEMLDYAEENLYGQDKAGGRYLMAFVNDNDVEFVDLVRQRGYVKDERRARPKALFVIPNPFPPILLPQGFRLKSLAEDCDWAKVHRVLWRGFNHPGEPPAEDLEDRKTMANTPNYRYDLNIVTVAPNGDYASFCGMWYVPTHCYAYVEPVATDPTYRRLGLGTAAVLEGIRRCGALGARVAYVGSDLEFYLSMGFKVVYTSDCWVKKLS